jgi:hypothetical protein
MNQDKADFVFEIAEFTVLSWLSELMEKPIDSLFHGGTKETRPIYINKSFKRFYEIKPEIVEYDYKLDLFSLNLTDGHKKQILEAMGFVMYCIKTVFMAHSRIIKEHIEEALKQDKKTDSEDKKESSEMSNLHRKSYFSPDFWTNIGLAMDHQNSTFYITYIHPKLLERDQLGGLINKLLSNKKTLNNPDISQEKKEDWGSNWNITIQKFTIIDNQIKAENIEEITNQWNDMLKTKKRLGVSVKEIKESDIPHQFKIKTIPSIGELQNVHVACKEYENIDEFDEL